MVCMGAISRRKKRLHNHSKVVQQSTAGMSGRPAVICIGGRQRFVWAPPSPALICIAGGCSCAVYWRVAVIVWMGTVICVGGKASHSYGNAGQ